VSWKPFTFGSVNLTTLDGAVAEGTGLVYSTAPQRAVGDDGGDYFVKGPDREVVFAELAGCVLANAVGLTVPSVRACQVAGEFLAGSRLVSNIRMIAPFLDQRQRVSNFEDVFDAVVVDIWLGNTDRNMGNIIGNRLKSGLIEFVFIDFEKSVTLRRFPTINSAGILDRDLWPRYELGDKLRRHKPPVAPRAMMDRNG
jgi:hypothetical protein